MKRLFIILLGLLACKPRPGSLQSKVDKMIIVDDAVIDIGNIQDIMAPVWWSVEIHDGETVYNNDLKQFSQGQRQLLGIEWYLAEVNNGGHDQFYLNSTGIVWEDALNGLRTIGAAEIASILKESVQRFGTPPSKDRTKRIQQLNQFKVNFGGLDERLYSAQKSIESKMLAYIKSHRSEFYYKGTVQVPQP